VVSTQTERVYLALSKLSYGVNTSYLSSLKKARLYGKFECRGIWPSDKTYRHLTDPTVRCDNLRT